MKTTHLFITLLFVAFGVANAQDKVECKHNSQEHIQFLEDFYVEYINTWDRESIHEGPIVLEKYCTKGLLRKISEMRQSFQLDYDPFVSAQDVWPGVLDYLMVEKYGKQKNVYEVSFHYLNEGDDDRTRIRLEVINTTNGCKVSDIISAYDPDIGLHYPLGR